MVDNKNIRIAKNTMFLYIRMLVVLLISLYTTRVVLRVLGAEDYGIYNVVGGFVALFGILNASFTTGANRYYNYALGKGDNKGVTLVYNTTRRIQFLVLLILFVLVETIGLWYLNTKMVIPPDRLFAANIIYQCSIVSLIIVIIQVPYSAAILAYERMDYYAIVSIIDVVLKLAFVIMLQYISWDKLIFYGLLVLATSLLNFLLYYIYCKKCFPLIIHSKVKDHQLFKELLSFSGWSLLDPITRTTQSQGSNIVLNYFFGPIINAASGIAYQVSAAIDSFTQNIAIAFRPQLIQSYSNGEETRVRQLMFSMSKVNYFLHIILMLPLILELNFVLNLWLGPNFPDFTIAFTSLILVARTIDSLHGPISLVMVASGKIKRIKIASAVIICSIIPMCICFYYFGASPNVTFILMIVLAAINLLVSVRIMAKEIRFIGASLYYRSVLIPCLLFSAISVILPIVVFLLLQPSVFRFLLIGFVSVVSVALCAYFQLFNEQERKMLLSLIKLPKKKK